MSPKLQVSLMLSKTVILYNHSKFTDKEKMSVYVTKDESTFNVTEARIFC